MTQPHGKTIQIYLPDGNPRSVKVAEFTSRTVQAVLVPRNQLQLACSRSELGNVAVYFLIGDTTTSSVPQLYVGETEDAATRLKDHNAKKDWWNAALVCVSKTQDFTKTHAKFLEWYCGQQATQAGRFKLENSTPLSKPHVSESMEADLLEHFDTIRILTTTLGFPLFEKIQKPKAKDLLVCKGKKADAKGEYTEDGLVVFGGSVCNRHDAPSMHKYASAIRDQLIEDGVLEVSGEDTLRFTKDHVFPSPSQAAMVVLARNANGWIEWKYSNGKTLDDVKRKAEAK